MGCIARAGVRSGILLGFRLRPVSVMDLLALAIQRRRVSDSSLAPEPAAPGPATAVDEERVPDERLAAKEAVPDEGLAVDGWKRKLWSDRVVWVKWIDGKRVRSSRPCVPCSTSGAAAVARCTKWERLTQGVVHGRAQSSAKFATPGRGRGALKPPPVAVVSVAKMSSETIALNWTSRAKLHGVTYPLLQRGMYSYAYAALLAQNVVMEMAIAHLELDRPTWVSVFPRWDEARHKLEFRYSGKLIPSAVETCVFLLAVSWGYSDPGRQPCFLEVVTPPIPVVATSVANILSAQRNH